MNYELSEVTDVACPVCRSSRGKRLYAVTSAQAAQHFARREVDPKDNEIVRVEVERLWGRDRAQVIRCDECGFCHADPFVSGSALFYGTTMKTPHYPRWRYEFDRTIEVLPRILPEFSEPTLLELGAGDGAFTHRATPALVPKDRVVCTEYSPAAAESIRKYGVKCEMLDPAGLKSAGYGNFAVVCLFQVLEHLDNLNGFFQSISSLTRENAAMFIGVPNGEFITFNEANGGLLDMPPNHVGRWNRKAFEIIAQRNGWKLLDHNYEPAKMGEVLRTTAEMRFFQNRNTPGTLTSRVSTSKRRTVRRLFASPLMLGSMISMLPVVMKSRGRPLGASQWAYLRRATTA